MMTLIFAVLNRSRIAFNISSARGQSALHLAALAQSPETVEFLLKSGKQIRASVLSNIGLAQSQICWSITMY